MRQSGFARLRVARDERPRASAGSWLGRFTATILVGVCSAPGLPAQPSQQTPDLDERVRGFLEQRRGTWWDMNVPEEDGRVLHDLILDNGYTRALEIGTSTGHSAIWIAWALAKTGGRLLTIEIDEGRHREAVASFEAAGLSKYIEARLADAHQLVPKLEGPFDFVFCDADKGWYESYFIAVAPKLVPGGCFTAHNVSMSRGRRGHRRGGVGEFLDLVESRPDFVTRIDRSSRAGISISFKRQR